MIFAALFGLFFGAVNVEHYHFQKCLKAGFPAETCGLEKAMQGKAGK